MQGGECGPFDSAASVIYTLLKYLLYGFKVAPLVTLQAALAGARHHTAARVLLDPNFVFSNGLVWLAFPMTLEPRG